MLIKKPKFRTSLYIFPYLCHHQHKRTCEVIDNSQTPVLSCP